MAYVLKLISMVFFITFFVLLILPSFLCSKYSFNKVCLVLCLKSRQVRCFQASRCNLAIQMGGGQSTDAASASSTTAFQYECDTNVAKYINANQEYFAELQSKIQGYATCQSVIVENNVGKVNLQSKQSSVTSTSKEECKRKLDEYFQIFMSCKEAVDPSMRFTSSFSSLLHGNGLRCSAQFESHDNKVRITGVKKDVKILINRIREAQNPPSTTAPQSSPTSSTSSTSKSGYSSNSGMSTRTTSQTFSPVSSYSGYTIATSSTYVNSGQVGGLQTPPSRAFQYDCSVHLAKFVMKNKTYLTALQSAIDARVKCLGVTIENNVGKVNLEIMRPPPPATMATLESECKADLFVFFQHFVTRVVSIDSAVHFPSLTSSLHKSGLSCSIEDNPNNHTIRITGVTSDVDEMTTMIEDINTRSRVPFLSSYFVYNIPAPDFSVARYIKFSNVHSQHLSQALSPIAYVDVDENRSSKKVEYICRPQTQLAMTEEDFKSSCESKLKDFLKNYSSKMKHFNREQLREVEEKEPDYFRQTRSYDRDAVFVRWFLENSKVLICGVKDDVAAKEQEIVDFINQTAPKRLSTSYLYKYPAPDYSIAKFIKHSERHKQYLSEAMDPVADVFVFLTKPDHRFEYRCRPLQELDSSEEEFIHFCESKLKEFLENYGSTKRYFNHDHLMKVVAKAPEYFQEQPSEDSETVFVKWFLEDNKVLVCGIKEEVKAKENEIIDFLNTTVPKPLKRAYKFDMEPPDTTVTRFIEQSLKHKSLMEQIVSDYAETWIVSRKLSVYFKATVELSPVEIPSFEEKCTRAMKSFLRNYSSWRHTYSCDDVHYASARNKQFFDEENEDIKLVINDGSEIVLVGLNESVNLMKTQLQHIMEKRPAQKNDSITSNNTPKASGRSARSRRKSTNCTNSGGALDWRRQPYVYQPSELVCINIVKHVFQSPGDMLELKHLVGLLVEFQVFPDQQNPQGVKFYAIEAAPIERHYFEVELPKVVDDFFARFMVTTRSFQTPYDCDHLIRIVVDIGHRHRVPSNMLSIERRPNRLVVIGHRNIILEIANVINGTVVACPNFNHQQRQLKSSTRRSSLSRLDDQVESDDDVSSVTSEQPISSSGLRSRTYRRTARKPKNTVKRSTKNKRPASVSSQKEQPTTESKNPAPISSLKKQPNKEPNMASQMKYHPKKAYLPTLKTVIESRNLYKKLQSHCKELCTISGESFPLEVVPLNPKKFESHPQFTKEVIKSIEGFLDSISKVVIPFDEEVGVFLKERKEPFLSKHFSGSDDVVLECNTDCLEITGMTDTVEACKRTMEEQLEITEKKKTCIIEVCRVLVDCGVIDEVNDVLRHKVEVTCCIDEGIVTLKGRTCYIDYAFEQLAAKGTLIEEVPALSEEKLTILSQLLSANGKTSNETYINKKLQDDCVKAVLMVRSDQIILTAMTRDVFNNASKTVDNVILSIKVDLPASTEKNFVEKEDWKSLIATLPDADQILVKVQSKNVEIWGVDEKIMKKASELIEEYLKKTVTSSRILVCQPRVKKYILKHCLVNNPNLPEGVEVKDVDKGLKISGSTFLVEKVVKYFCLLTLQRAELSYSCPNLASHFASDAWKGFLNLLEGGVRCSISYDVENEQIAPSVNKIRDFSTRENRKEESAPLGKSQKLSQEEMEKNEVFPSTHGDVNFDSGKDKTAKYGSVTVSVCHGDITKDDSEVIVNGATSDFDLSRGTVSPALLRAAGQKMQEQCTSHPVESSPVLRITHGWNLLCDYVIHLVTPREEDKLTSRIKDALDYAEVLGKESVSLPTLGAGGVGLRCDAVADSMSEAFEEFASENPQRVKLIKVVVYDYNILNLFQNTIVKSKEIMSFGKKEALAAKKKAEASLVEDHVIIHIVSEEEADLSEANRKIKAHMEERIEKKIVKDDLISELDDHDCIDIYQAAVKHQVSVTFNTMSCEIILNGLSKNVSKLYDVIRELLFELRESMTMSKLFDWKWASSSKQFTALPLRVGRAIERDYEKKKTGSPQVSLYGTTLDLDFSAMTYTFNHMTGHLKRVDSSAQKIPSDWSDMMGKTFLKVPLTLGSAEYSRVTKLFKMSSPSYIKIINIERIQHPSLYKQYLIKKSDVERHMISKHPVERELFHGTSEDGADKICAEGFDRNFAGKNATVYGKGSYFAVNSNYSVKYASPSISGTKYLFLARVLTGDFRKGHHDYKAPPQKVHSGDIVRLYDSVVDSETNPSIFVVFKDSSVYPYYLITFF